MTAKALGRDLAWHVPGQKKRPEVLVPWGWGPWDQVNSDSMLAQKAPQGHAEERGLFSELGRNLVILQSCSRLGGESVLHVCLVFFSLWFLASVPSGASPDLFPGPHPAQLSHSLWGRSPDLCELKPCK